MGNAILQPSHEVGWIAGQVECRERLVGYTTRCAFSLSRLVQVTATGQLVYKAENDACRAFPDSPDAGLASGPTRNFQILDPLCG